MELEEAIRTRRTHKVFGPEPVDSRTLDELLGIAIWAPNHRLTNPWRFRVLGPHSRAALRAAAAPEDAAKLDRAPTLVAVTVIQTGDPVQDEEDLLATGCAVYALLLAAHGRGLAGYWRTPAVLRTEAGLAALQIPDLEHFVALVHLGPLRQHRDPPDRLPLSAVTTLLD